MKKTKVYIAKTDALQNNILFNKLYHTVSFQRQAKTDRYVNRSDKILSIAAEALLIFALKKENITDFEIEYRKNGKPYLKNTDNAFFSLSHSGNTVMCALSGDEVGCDTEKVREVKLQTAKRFFCPDECAAISSSKTEDEKRAVFFRLWTLKESFMKATGIGMSLKFNSFCFDITGKSPKIRRSADNETYFFREYDFKDGCRYSVCSKLPDIQDAVFVDLNEL